MPAGSHTLTVSLLYQGNDSGLFSHLSKYKFLLRDTLVFDAAAGNSLVLEVAGYEQGNIFTTQFTDRPALRMAVRK